MFLAQGTCRISCWANEPADGGLRAVVVGDVLGDGRAGDLRLELVLPGADPVVEVAAEGGDRGLVVAALGGGPQRLALA